MLRTFATTFILLVFSFHAFPQSIHYEVYAFRYCGAFNDQPYSLKQLVLDAPEAATGKAAFMFWLIKGENSRNILVDAGFSNDIEDAKDFAITNFIRPDSLLSSMGLKPADITDIIITHPHWDHIDGVDLFPKAHVWMQKEDYNYFVGAVWQANSGGFNKRDVRKIVEVNLEKRLTLVDGDNKEIIPGIHVYTGSRHTYNSQYVAVNTGSGNVVIASDNAYTYYNIDHLKSAAAGSTFDPKGYINAIRRMKTIVSDPRYIIPGHDAEVFSKFPLVAENVVRIK